MSGRLILALDGSTGACSVALLELSVGPGAEAHEPLVCGMRMVHDGRAHARLLLRMADEVLEERGAAPSDLAAVMVGTGPGTFTGVRVTVAAARGMALALGIPVVGASTLSALAAMAATQEGVASGAGSGGAEGASTIVPLIDARRGQVFYAVYRRAETPEEPLWTRVGDFGVCAPGALTVQLTEAVGARSCDAERLRVISEASVLASLPAFGECLVAADASADWLVLGQARLEEPAGVLGGRSLLPWLRAAVGSKRPWTSAGAAVGAPGTPESVVPIYVRAPDADLHITKMRDPWGV